MIREQLFTVTSNVDPSARCQVLATARLSASERVVPQGKVVNKAIVRLPRKSEMGSVIYGLESKVSKWPQRETPNRKNENGNADSVQRCFKQIYVFFMCISEGVCIF